MGSKKKRETRFRTRDAERSGNEIGQQDVVFRSTEVYRHPQNWMCPRYEIIDLRAGIAAGYDLNTGAQWAAIPAGSTGLAVNIYGENADTADRPGGILYDVKQELQKRLGQNVRYVSGHAQPGAAVGGVRSEEDLVHRGRAIVGVLDPEENKLTRDRTSSVAAVAWSVTRPSENRNQAQDINHAHLVLPPGVRDEQMKLIADVMHKVLKQRTVLDVNNGRQADRQLAHEMAEGGYLRARHGDQNHQGVSRREWQYYNLHKDPERLRERRKSVAYRLQRNPKTGLLREDKKLNPGGAAPHSRRPNKKMR